MHRLIFGHSFAELVALILLPGIAFYFLNKKKTSARRNAEDVDTSTSGSMTAPTETNSGASSSSPTETTSGGSSSSWTETNYGASSSSPAETNSSESSSSPTKTNNCASSSSPIETKSGGSTSSLTETDNGTSNSSPTETNSGGSSSSLMETNKGASSSLTASTGNSYEVFLSFRGSDTRKGFTDHLYNGLLDAGIDVFRDEDELREGENIIPELLAAITNSKILIPILSVNYGTSSWCLDELVQIMKCKNNNGHIVLPIFYKVKPADVGHQIGSFGDGFHAREKRLLERRFDPTILKKWKQALLEVSTLKGYEADG
ncbi:hypothetical protein NL676_007058, partial [Syzygium grande]